MYEIFFRKGKRNLWLYVLMFILLIANEYVFGEEYSKNKAIHRCSKCKDIRLADHKGII